jgi:Glycosyl hydrolase family 12
VSGYDGDAFLSEAKQRVRLSEGTIVRRVIVLHAACSGVRCPSGLACDPQAHECADIPSTSSEAPGAPVADGGEADADVANDDGGTAGTGGMSEPRAGSVASETAGSTAGEAGGGGAGGESIPTGGIGPLGAGSGAGNGSAGEIAMTAGSGAGRGGAGDGAAGLGGSGGVSGGGAGGSDVAGAGGSGGVAGEPVAGSGGGGTGGTPPVGPVDGVLTGAGDKVHVTHQGVDYVVQNNVYSPGASQTLTYAGTAFTITDVMGSDPAGISFPAAYIGSVYRDRTSGSSLPMAAGSVESIEVSFTSNAGDVPGAYHMAHAFWFSAGPEEDGSLPSGGFLEVWYHVQGGHVPTGTLIASAVVIDSVPGTFDLWQGTCFDEPCIAYVATQAFNSVQGDLAPFLRDAMNRPNGVASNWYLSAVFAGFEIHSGGDGLQATDITIAVR